VQLLKQIGEHLRNEEFVSGCTFGALTAIEDELRQHVIEEGAGEE
jgi:hypothetical protein